MVNVPHPVVHTQRVEGRTPVKLVEPTFNRRRLGSICMKGEIAPVIGFDPSDRDVSPVSSPTVLGTVPVHIQSQSNIVRSIM